MSSQPKSETLLIEAHRRWESCRQRADRQTPRVSDGALQFRSGGIRRCLFDARTELGQGTGLHQMWLGQDRAN